MAVTGEEIRRNLVEFASRWDTYLGSERAEAQPFLEELLACFGVDRRDAGVRFEDWSGEGFMDLHWPGVCIVEMKRPSETSRLEHYYETQALPYWHRSGGATHGPAKFIMLSSFRRFLVWQPGYPEPRADFELKALPENLDALLFLAGSEPVFLRSQGELTRDAAGQVTEMLRCLHERDAADEDVLRDFALQCVWCMFAEDLGMLPAHVFTRLVEELLEHPSRSTRDDLGQLFRYLNEPHDRPREGMYADLPYADGALFLQPALVHLERDELELLRSACDSPWHRVEPAIFGSLLEGALGRELQWSLGAHYTAETDIAKVVLPTVVEPWRERLSSIESLAEAQAAQSDLMNYVVLDPACGSGNFLYVAYRQLRRIEAELRARVAELRREAGLGDQESIAFFPLTNMRGIEIEPFAVKLARVTLWMGHKLAVQELDLPERVLPLVDLSGIQRGDALRIEWPRADAIIGNPPYHGSQMIRGELGDEYAEWIRQEFGIGLRDYAVYWFRKAHEGLPDGGRAGLVATNSVSQGRARQVSLHWIVANGGLITNAVSKQPWPGAAVVNVSIINWVKNPSTLPDVLLLDGREVPGISSSLRAPLVEVSGAERLLANRGKAFQGPIPAGAGFILDREEALSLLARPEASYKDVLRPYLIGDDIVDDPEQKPRRWIIDFEKKPLEEAATYPAALGIVRDRVKPERDVANREPNRTFWWQFERPRVEMRRAIESLPRYIAGNAQGKRVFFCWQEPAVCPSNLTNVFAFDDDFSIGALISTIHHEWARAQSSTLRVDIRYTPTSAFATFPWPQPSLPQRDAISEISRALIGRRSKICREREIGLTRLYNEVDEGAYRDLRDLHRHLDEAVAAAYGWPASVAHDTNESNRRLLELNRAIAAGEVEYEPFRERV
jgi:hypothetical protein